jgi:hypothetical protein
LGRFALCAIGVAVAALASLMWQFGVGERHHPVEEQAAPSVATAPSATTPYLNAASDVQYVGDEACTDCHLEQAKTFRKHPMGQSLRPVSEVAALQDYTPRVNDPFEALGFQFSAERQGNSVIHREIMNDGARRPIVQTEATISYAIGSGTHGMSYLIDHEGVLTQSPITWFPQKKAWDLSPGFKEQRERFERPIAAGCLFCHCNYADSLPDTMNSYRRPIFRGLAIGCERCHGPGELHVRARKSGGVLDGADLTIVDPERLNPARREAICEQCHLGGSQRVLRRGHGAFDFRPGLPLAEFWRVLVLPEGGTRNNRVAGHVEQMHASQCFQRSEGQLGCVSCHDPHSLPPKGKKVDYFRARCLECHQKQGCAVPVATRQKKTPRDDCTVCHMPQEATDISHVALTDHRILRRPAPSEPAGAEQPSAAAFLGLVPFGRDRLDGQDRELARDFAVGVIEKARTQSESFRLQASQFVLPVLQEAAAAHSDDWGARESLGVALAWQGSLEAALAACEATLEKVPGREIVLFDAAVIAQKLGMGERSLGYWQRALAINPWSSRYRFEAAFQLAQQGDWEKAAAECQRVLSYNGSHVNSRALLMQHHLQRGLREQARADLEAILALHPPNESDVRRMFNELSR